MEHFTAWITTTADCLVGDFCDVSVLRDEVIGYREDWEGNETPEWSSAGEGPVFTADLAVRHDDRSGDTHGRAIDEAETALRKAGWTVEQREWESVTTGWIATVSRDA